MSFPLLPMLSNKLRKSLRLWTDRALDLILLTSSGVCKFDLNDF